MPWRKLLCLVAWAGAEVPCKGRVGHGPLWQDLRGNLSFYTAMNLASREITLDVQSPVYWQMREIWRQIDTNATLSAKASRDCAVGYVTLKLIGFMSLKVTDLLAELLKPEGVMIHEALRFLASTLDWHQVAETGWPLFRLLARLEYFAFAEMGAANPLNEKLESAWSYEVPFLETVERSLEEGVAVPAAASSLLLSYHEFYSPLARGLALLSLAETLRPPRLALAEVGERERLIRRGVYLLGDNFLSSKYPPFVALSARWPVFQLADRLACQGEVRWQLPAHGVKPKLRVAVLPVPEKVSDVVRACRLPYCDLSFMELMLRAAAGSGAVHLVEMGANLGDCSLWAAAHLGRRLRSVVAVEPVPNVAAALRRSVQLNRWDEKIQVVQALAAAQSGWGKMHFLGHADGNPYASASAVAPESFAAPSVPARRTTLAWLLRHMPRGRGAARVLKIYTYGDLRAVLAGAGAALARVDALWLAFAAGQLRRPGAAAVLLFALLRRRFRVALPSFEADWCRGAASKTSGSAERRMFRWLRQTGKNSAYSMVYVVAFRPGSLVCRPWSARPSPGHMKAAMRSWDKTGAARGCFFGRSRRQLLMAKRYRAGYESYFLGDEEFHMEQLMRNATSGLELGQNRLSALLYLLQPCMQGDGDVRPPNLPLEDDERAERWFHRKLKTKDRGKIRAKLCNKLTEQLRDMGYEIIGSDRAAAIERVSEALTQGTAEEGPLVCSILAKELEGTRFDHLWVSQDGKGTYRLGEDGMKVAVQVLDGKLLIHGYFEGSLIHPVRVPVVTFLAEFGRSSQQEANDDCDLFGSTGPPKATPEAEKDRSRSPKHKVAHHEHAANEHTLPPGWVKKESRSKPGVYYYANEAKGLTQFERPA
ncbi:unnamed protein product [Effrenium voratum]|nr:unnamed protein product [Effrenium voratum]